MDLAERNRLAAKWHPMARKVAAELWRTRPVVRRFGGLDDVVQVGCLGLLESLGAWDPARAKGGSFRSWLYHGIRDYVLDKARYQGLIRVPAYLQEKTPRAGYHSQYAAAVEQALRCGPLTEKRALRLACGEDYPGPGDEAEGPAAAHARNVLRTGLAALRPHERRLLGEYYGLDQERLNTREIAALEGAPIKTVQARLRRTLVKLRRACGVAEAA